MKVNFDLATGDVDFDFGLDLNMQIGGIVYDERDVAKIMTLARDENVALATVDLVLEKLGPMIRAAVRRADRRRRRRKAK